MNEFESENNQGKKISFCRNKNQRKALLTFDIDMPRLSFAKSLESKSIKIYLQKKKKWNNILLLFHQKMQKSLNYIFVRSYISEFRFIKNSMLYSATTFKKHCQLKIVFLL